MERGRVWERRMELAKVQYHKCIYRDLHVSEVSICHLPFRIHILIYHIVHCTYLFTQFVSIKRLL